MANKADNQIKWVLNKMPKSDDKQVANMSLEEMSKANNFHKSFPQYSVTPLTGLPHLAEYLGLKKLYVKDESYRFGLNAFKVLGGSYAIARYMAQQLGKDVSEVPYDVLTSEKLKEDFGQATFFTATDGNHGRGVAWAANKLGQKCVVRMPKGTTQTRLNNIAKENATVTIENLNYDECVRMAAKEAAETDPTFSHNPAISQNTMKTRQRIMKSRPPIWKMNSLRGSLRKRKSMSVFLMCGAAAARKPLLIAAVLLAMC